MRRPTESPPFIHGLALFFLAAVSSQAAEYPISSAAELNRLSRELKPGDVVVMRDGTWTDQEVVFRGTGTEKEPITLRAETPGKVVLDGKSSLIIDGDWLLVSGLCLQGGGTAKDGIALKGRNCRLTESAVIDATYKFFVHVFGTENRVDHCSFAGKTSDSPTMQIEAEMAPNRHRIDHNDFGPRPPLGRNGGETIRIGYSHQSFNESQTLVEENFFRQCDGELEIISSKSCGNIYRRNVFYECAGMLTLRHGNRCRVEGNVFLGNHKKGSGGIRIIGEDHVVVNNYIDGVMQGGIWVTAGIPNSPLVGYFQARNCLIAFNTIVDSQGPYLDLAAGLGSSGRTLPPDGITVANNLFSVPAEGVLCKGTEDRGFRWIGNLAGPGSPERAGLKAVDLKLVRDVDAKLFQALGEYWVPAADSPARNIAEGDFPTVTTDLWGKPRAGGSIVGCDQMLPGVRDVPLGGGAIRGPQWRIGRIMRGK